jgi:hypothetical protein
MSLRLSEDITEIGPSFANPLVGKKNFFRKYEAYFSSSLRIESYRILRPRIVELSTRFVLVHFTYQMRTSNKGVVENSKGKESMLVEKKARRWLVKFIHWHRDPDA